MIDFSAIFGGPVTAGYGPVDPSSPAYDLEPGHFHRGVDIGLPEGSPVITPVGGVVTREYVDPLGGNVEEITTASGFRQLFAHLSDFVAQVGDTVTYGQEIAHSGGAVGAPGAGSATTGPHLLYEVHDPFGAPVDPGSFIQNADANAPSFADLPTGASPDTPSSLAGAANRGVTDQMRANAKANESASIANALSGLGQLGTNAIAVLAVLIVVLILFARGLSALTE